MCELRLRIKNQDTGMAETKLLQIQWDNIKDKEEIENFILEHQI